MKFQSPDQKSLWSVILLIEIFMLVFLTGFFPEHWHVWTFYSLFILLNFTTAMALNSNRSIMLWSALVLLTVASIARFFELPVLEILSKTLNFIFFSVIVSSFIKQIANAQTVTKRVLLEAVNGYLLLGILFTFLISLMVQVEPLSFNFSAGNSTSPYDVLYYCFVTFATLGYGDLVPLKPYAKSLAILIAVGGQLYIAVIIALLMGKFSSQSG